MDAREEGIMEKEEFLELLHSDETVLNLIKQTEFVDRLTQKGIEFEITDVIDAMMEWIFQCTTLQAIEEGTIDPRGKTADQLDEELTKYIIKTAQLRRSGRATIEFRIDYTKNLLVEADKYVASGNFYIACILYFTWVEHIVNRILIVHGLRHGQTAEQIATMIINNESLSFNDKLEQIPLGNNHKAKIRDLQKIRRKLVHYDWIGETTNDTTQVSIESIAKEFSPTVNAICDYINREILRIDNVDPKIIRSASEDTDPSGPEVMIRVKRK